MKSKKILPVLLFLLISSVLYFGCGDSHDDQMHNQEQMQDMQNNDQMDAEVLGNEVVRDEPIDVKSIDENNDGYVYQDPMDWNVISDKPGNCPVCGMKLEKVSIEEAKDNLVKNDFKIKEN